MSNAATAKKAFKILTHALKYQPIMGDKGVRNNVSADEFMYMGEGQRQDRTDKWPWSTYEFKHRKSRNYLAVEQGGHKVFIPKTGKAFEKGVFPEDVNSFALSSLMEELQSEAGVELGEMKSYGAVDAKTVSDGLSEASRALQTAEIAYHKTKGAAQHDPTFGPEFYSMAAGPAAMAARCAAKLLFMSAKLLDTTESDFATKMSTGVVRENPVIKRISDAIDKVKAVLGRFKPKGMR